MAASVPETHYAMAEKGVHIAYQVFGSGAYDLVFVPPFLSNVEVWWELPIAARFFNRLASFARVILLDKRGTGLSDRLSTVETPEERMDDIRAVMDAVGSKRAAIFGASDGVAISIIFAATYPDRAVALLLWGGVARYSPAPDYPWSLADDLYTQIVELSSSQWGTGFTAPLLYPSRADEPGIRDWFAHYERVSASPGGLARLLLNNTALDIRPILPSIQAPTLVIHPEGDTFVPVGGSRYLAAHIPGAKYVEPPGHDHLPFGENGDLLVEEIEEFLTGSRGAAAPDRVLATVLVIEILAGVDGEHRLSEDSWRDRTEQFVEAARKELTHHRGVEVDVSSDRLLATFDGPARGIHCAESIGRAANRLGIQMRTGLHTGECVQIAGKIGGIALQVAAAVKDQAAPGEIAVSSTVRDLVSGAGIAFEERGKFRLPNVPSEWGVLVVRPAGPSPGLDPAREAFEAAVERAVGGPRTGPLAPLSKRESEVALLVASGLTNRQIASRLFLSDRTVEWHLEQILGKLGFTNRAQVASWISRQKSHSIA
jgi:pimeloyl-ACP methyl ester carboxylesterase/DNA-binding CsgD family transcriptional regulator/class 3 adenylate cyclase